MFDTYYINKPNEALEWAKVIVPVVALAVSPILTIWLTNKYQREQKNFEMVRQREINSISELLDKISSYYYLLLNFQGNYSILKSVADLEKSIIDTRSKRFTLLESIDKYSHYFNEEEKKTIFECRHELSKFEQYTANRIIDGFKNVDNENDFNLLKQKYYNDFFRQSDCDYKKIENSYQTINSIISNKLKHFQVKEKIK